MQIYDRSTLHQRTIAATGADGMQWWLFMVQKDVELTSLVCRCQCTKHCSIVAQRGPCCRYPAG